MRAPSFDVLTSPIRSLAQEMADGDGVPRIVWLGDDGVEYMSKAHPAVTRLDRTDHLTILFKPRRPYSHYHYARISAHDR